MRFDEQDNLYALLPAVHRLRDAAEGEPLRALLDVIAAQARDLHADIGRLYENWFIETCEDWVVPYLADLVGYRRVLDSGSPGDVADPRGRLLNRILFPRREIANTVRMRRRKGTLPVLEELARHVAGWSARAVEFAPLVVRTPSIRSVWPHEGGTVSLRDRACLAELGTPFDTIPRTVDTRAIRNAPGLGWHNIPHVLLFVWRRRAESVTGCRPGCVPQARTDPRHFTFDTFGRCVPLYVKPVAEESSNSIADKPHLPVPLTREMLEEDGRASPQFYGPEKSVAVYNMGTRGSEASADERKGELVRADRVLVCDLSTCACRRAAREKLRRRPGTDLVIDPECGLFLDGRDDRAAGDYRVTYHVAAAGTIGSGELPRTRADVPTSSIDWIRPEDGDPEKALDISDKIQEALEGTSTSTARGETEAVRLTIELATSDVHEIRSEAPLTVPDGATLVIRAARNKRPVICVSRGADECDGAWKIRLGRRSHLLLDGVTLAGPLVIEPLQDAPATPAPIPAAKQGNTDPFPSTSEPPEAPCACEDASPVPPMRRKSPSAIARSFHICAPAAAKAIAAIRMPTRSTSACPTDRSASNRASSARWTSGRPRKRASAAATPSNVRPSTSASRCTTPSSMPATRRSPLFTAAAAGALTLA